MLNYIIARIYVQHAYTGMSVDSVEAEIKECRNTQQAIQYTLDILKQRGKPARDY